MVNIDMSKDSTQNIPQEATKLKKLSKVTARYMQMDPFPNRNMRSFFMIYSKDLEAHTPVASRIKI
jgi:hypothetical protein